MIDSAAEHEMDTRKEGGDSPSPYEQASSLPPVEPLELVREEQDEVLPTVVDSGPVVLDQAAQALLNVDAGKTQELATRPLGWLATAPAAQSEAASDITPDRNEPIDETSGTIDSDAPSTHVEPSVASNTPTNPEVEAQVAPPTSQAPVDTARSLPVHEWTDLTATVPANESEPEIQQITTPEQSSAQVPASTVESSQAATVNPTEPPAPDPALVEAVVQRVLDKMRPQVVDIITKEFLRPVVLALVHREIEKL